MNFLTIFLFLAILHTSFSVDVDPAVKVRRHLKRIYAKAKANDTEKIKEFFDIKSEDNLLGTDLVGFFLKYDSYRINTIRQAASRRIMTKLTFFSSTDKNGPSSSLLQTYSIRKTV
ncbi:Protein CBG26732 [Caenorhabditis briggsae]|uniref:Protein CBG26732 n=1 Tax=Caenorhabditis briggsae TaxID=6238 RepID=B6IEA7_CAEBR|nr:Protein CBG26732 [Caenorhabditis briggsae]CAS01171.1 Protein CBG26732 [Caenorhabditis briggsae]